MELKSVPDSPARFGALKLLFQVFFFVGGFLKFVSIFLIWVTRRWPLSSIKYFTYVGHSILTHMRGFFGFWINRVRFLTSLTHFFDFWGNRVRFLTPLMHLFHCWGKQGPVFGPFELFFLFFGEQGPIFDPFDPPFSLFEQQGLIFDPFEAFCPLFGSSGSSFRSSWSVFGATGFDFLVLNRFRIDPKDFLKFQFQRVSFFGTDFGPKNHQKWN